MDSKTNVAIFIVIMLLFTALFTVIGIVYWSPESEKVEINKVASLYQNNVTINSDGTLTFDVLIEWDMSKFDNNGFKSIAYSINDAIATDFEDFDQDNHLNDDVSVNAPYVDTNFYYVKMKFDEHNSDIYRTYFSYTLSNDYVCCVSVPCEATSTFKIFLPWMHRWQYKSLVEEFDLNLYYAKNASDATTGDFTIELENTWADNTEEIAVDGADYARQFLYNTHFKGDLGTDPYDSDLEFYFEMFNVTSSGQFAYDSMAMKCSVASTYYSSDFSYKSEKTDGEINGPFSLVGYIGMCLIVGCVAPLVYGILLSGALTGKKGKKKSAGAGGQSASVCGGAGAAAPGTQWS